MAEFFKKVIRQIASLFTDKDFDADATKVFGFGLMVCAVVGFFLTLPEWSIMLGIGGAMCGVGKFSKEG